MKTSELFETRTIINEIFNSFDGNKISDRVDTNAEFSRTVKLSTDDKLVFSAFTMPVTYGDAIWSVSFTVNNTTDVGVNTGVDTNEVFSFVIGFLEELRNQGVKAYHFTSDSDHLKVYKALIRRFGKGMNVIHEVKGGWNEFVVHTTDFEFGYNEEDDGTSYKIYFPLGNIWSSKDEFIGVDEYVYLVSSSKTTPILDFLLDYFEPTLKGIGRKLTEKFGTQLRISNNDNDANLDAHDFSMYFGINVLTGFAIDSHTYQHGDKTYWSAYGYDDDDEHFEANAKDKGGYWELDLMETYNNQSDIIAQFITDVKVDFFTIRVGYAGNLDDISPHNGTVVSLGGNNNLYIKDGVDLPINISNSYISFDAIPGFEIGISLEISDNAISFEGVGNLEDFGADDENMESILTIIENSNLKEEFHNFVKTKLEQYQGYDIDTSGLDDQLVDLFNIH